jgi:thiamine-phosphate diphosphorylase
VGQGDLPAAAVRRLAGERLVVGVSTSRLEQARAALAAGADGCGVGPMHASGTKHKDEIVGTAYLAAYLEWDRLPHLAIGGIDAGRAGRLAAIGARGVAVCAAVCGADDPEAAAREILAAMDAGAATRMEVRA